MRPVIKSRKHYVQFPINQVATGVVENMLLIEAVAVSAKNISREVEEGAIVKACYIELWLQNQSNLGHTVVIISKQNELGLGATFAEMATLDTWTNKKNILFTHEGLTTNDSQGPPLPVLHGWYKIPKSKQRFGLGDILSITVSNPSSNSLDRCGFATFKEYT